MNPLIKLAKNEDGAALVLVALAMVGLMGFAALVVDVGGMYSAKAKLQNAADAAALAGARELPDVSTAISTVENYAERNGVPKEQTAATTPYDGDSKLIEVICTRNVSYTFARVLGFTDTDISARAVAKSYSEWDGDALPFMNLDDDYENNSEIVAWEKTTPGDFESINEYEIVNEDDPDTVYFRVNYMDGVELTKGTVATVKQEVGYIYNRHKPQYPGGPYKPVYVLSLSADVMRSGQIKLADGSYRPLDKLKNKDVVDPSQIVLLECIFHTYDEQAKNLYLKVTDVFDIANDELPPDYVSPDGADSKLVT